MNDKKNVLKIIFYMTLLIPFFQIPFFTENFSKLNLIYTILLVLSSLFIIIMVVLKKKYSKIINTIVIYMLILLFSTIINKGNIYFCLKNIISLLGICLFCDYGIRYDKKDFLSSMKYFFCILIAINFITILFYPNGMYMKTTGYIENWFLGYKNTHILFMIPALLISYVKDEIEEKKKTSSHILLFFCLVSTLVVKNSTGLIGLFIISIFIIFQKLFSITKLFNIWNYILIYISSFFLIILMRIQNAFSYLIINVLKKDLTFTGRVYIWDKAIIQIKQKLILGYGDVSFKFNDYIYSTHNGVLGIMHKTGFAGVLVYVVLMIQTACQIWKYKTHNIAKLISIILLAYFIMMITESYNFNYYLFIFVIAYNIKYLIEEKLDEKNNITC